MAENGQLARLDRLTPGEPNLAELLDPIALEERLKEARARRAEALARRSTAAVPAPASAAAPVALAEPPVAPLRPAMPPVLTAEARVLPPRRSRSAYPLLLFLAGLGLGGGAVAITALQMLPERLAAPTPAPAAPAPVATAAPEAAAPEVAAAPPPEIAAEPEVAAAAPPPETAAGPPAMSPPLPATDTAKLAADLATPAAFTRIEPPAPAPLEPLSLETTPPAAAPAASLPPLAVTPEPAAADPLPAQVYIHFPSSAGATAAAARDALLAAGVARVDIVPVRFAIGRSNIRFYHDSDRAAAATLSGLMADTLADGSPDARDFTDYPTPPASGKVEVWLAGTPDARTSPAAARPAAAAPRPVATAPLDLRPAPMPAARPGDQAQAVERILIERTVQRLLEQNRSRP